MSTEPITTLSDLRKSKSWVPEGDPISTIFFKVIGVNPTPLSIPDVLTSLQTGLINTTYNSYYGAIVLQWFTRIKYITDIPFVYGYGGLVLDLKKFSSLPADYAALMESAAEDQFAKLLTGTEGKRHYHRACHTRDQKGTGLLSRQGGSIDDRQGLFQRNI
jgi:TRAP-type C4-dicarboxylate transport system substrate-binding protein